MLSQHLEGGLIEHFPWVKNQLVKGNLDTQDALKPLVGVTLLAI